jgi:hypothetical protein
MKYVLPLRTKPLDPSVPVANKTTSDPLSAQLQFKRPLRVVRELSFPLNIIHSSFHVLIQKERKKKSIFLVTAAILNDFFLLWLLTSLETKGYTWGNFPE